jgi:hypothetical protein
VFSGSRSQQKNQRRWSEVEELAEEVKEVRDPMTSTLREEHGENRGGGVIGESAVIGQMGGLKLIVSIFPLRVLGSAGDKSLADFGSLRLIDFLWLIR